MDKKLERVFHLNPHSGFPVELSAPEEAAYPAVVIGSAATPPGAKVAALAEHRDALVDSVAVFIGEDATTEKLVALLDEC